ncbi:MAG: peptidoglycan DD-metalloendopeptidase family protein [Proteobacteria bacterium]|nr:peptidoglycan DD-metalloendopeptidase family protein [Pseudomonadota bacterium]
MTRIFDISFTRLLVFTLLTLCLLAAPASANQKDLKEEELKALQVKISKLKQTIDVKEDSKSRYTRQLEKIERKVGALSRKIRDTEKKIGRKQAELKKLRKTRKQHQQQLSRENDILAQQVYTAFTLGTQEKAKLLFSQQDPEIFQRNLVYYQYFSNARVKLIDNVKANIDKIIETEIQINNTRLGLEKNHKLQKTQIAQLSKDRNKRKSIIALLDKLLKKQGRYLSKLEDDANQLQNLISSIQEILTETPLQDPEFDRKTFAMLKGKLAWPVKGKLKQLFGRRKPLSGLRWQGIVIDAPAGRYVRAISHGRIAFADWLRGMGNLVIIDHGNSYLSLYGHNESLFKSAGEWVESGDIISSIGNSGGQSQTGLYFEIRKKGKPQDPTRWCKSSNLFTS